MPTANANDTPEGFISVLSTAVEMKGVARPNSKELNNIQIQTRYPDAFPPESINAFQTFVLACELMANPSATQEEADAILDSLGIIPRVDANEADNRVDANEADKVFENMSVTSSAYRYETYFTSGPIDELTLTVTPLAHEMQTTKIVDNSAAASEAKEQDTAADTQQDVSDVPPMPEEQGNSSDVPEL